jgi:hypothetical protein
MHRLRDFQINAIPVVETEEQTHLEIAEEMLKSGTIVA